MAQTMVMVGVIKFMFAAQQIRRSSAGDFRKENVVAACSDQVAAGYRESRHYHHHGYVITLDGDRREIVRLKVGIRAESRKLIRGTHP